MRLSRYLGRVASVTAAAVLAGTSITSAADLGGGSYKDPVYVPPVVDQDIWTGFYIGGQAGIGAGRARGKGNVATRPDDVTPFANLYSFNESTNLTGGMYGIYGGYNWQMGNTVLGLEGDYTWSDVEGSTACGAGGPFVFNVAKCKVDLDWAASIVGRAGYAVGKHHFYGKAGGTWGRVQVGADTSLFGPPPLRGSQSSTRFGWIVGMGYEYAFTRNFIMRIDYSHMDFGSKSFNFGYNDVLGADGDVRVNSRVKTTVDAVKLGAAFKF